MNNNSISLYMKLFQIFLINDKAIFLIPPTSPEYELRALYSAENQI